MSDLPFDAPRDPGQAFRWAAAALLVAGLHAGAGWWLAGHSFAPPPAPDGVAGVTIDLEPVAVPAVALPEAPAPLETVGSGPTPQVAEAPDAPAPPPEPVTPSVVPPQVADPVEPPPSSEATPPQLEPTPVPPTPADVPPVALPEVATPSDAVLAPMPPARPPVPVPPRAVAKPAPAKPVVKPAPPKPDPRRLAQEEARREAQAEAREQRRAARAEARATRAAQAREGGGEARETAAPTPTTSGAALSTWKGAVMAHMRAYTPTSPNGAAGHVKVAFTVDRGGRITSASVSSSSGDPQLDQTALAAVRRASPVPAPPPELGGRASVGIPIHFN